MLFVTRDRLLKARENNPAINCAICLSTFTVLESTLGLYQATREKLCKDSFILCALYSITLQAIRIAWILTVYSRPFTLFSRKKVSGTLYRQFIPEKTSKTQVKKTFLKTAE